MEKYLELGQIVNTFGIRGQVKVKPFTDDIKKFDTFKEIFVEKKNQLQSFQIEKVNYSKGMVILKLKGIETPEQAETLRNCYIKMDRKNAKKLPALIDQPHCIRFVILAGHHVCLNCRCSSSGHRRDSRCLVCHGLGRLCAYS